MAKLPSFKRIVKSDYTEEYRSLIETLASSLNIGVDSVYDALNRKLTFRDNIKSTTKDIEVILDASGFPKVATSFLVDITGQVDGLWVIRSENITSPTSFPTSGIHISFTQTSNVITVNHITGLQANNRYKLRILIIGA